MAKTGLNHQKKKKKKREGRSKPKVGLLVKDRAGEQMLLDAFWTTVGISWGNSSPLWPALVVHKLIIELVRFRQNHCLPAPR